MFSRGFPEVFPGFPRGFPGVSLGFSRGFPAVSLGFSRGFPGLFVEQPLASPGSAYNLTFSNVQAALLIDAGRQLHFCKSCISAKVAKVAKVIMAEELDGWQLLLPINPANTHWGNNH